MSTGHLSSSIVKSAEVTIRGNDIKFFFGISLWCTFNQMLHEQTKKLLNFNVKKKLGYK